MSANYIVSAKKATVVTDAVVGNFTGDDELNLVLAKINRVHIYKVTSEGLKSVQEVPVFGRITSMKLFRAKGETRDSLLILTAKFNLAILGWDSEGNTVCTRAAGSVADRVGRESDYGSVACVHSSGLIALRIYDGVLKVIQWSDGSDLKCFNVRFEDLNILDITFTCVVGEEMRLSYISQDSNGRHLKTVELNFADKELKTISKQDNIENEATMIVPVPAPYGGVVVVGQDTILYNSDDNTFMSISPPLMRQTQFICYAPIDKNGQRYLLADDTGRLFMLLLDMEDGMDGVSKVKDMKLEYLGETSIAQTLVYLDNGVVFVGSRFGDSQLIRLTTEPGPDNTFVTVLETFVNLAPIRDMAVIEDEGQTHLVTCSGAFKDGSLRIIRNGIGIEEAAAVDLAGVKGIFTLRVGAPLDNYILVSFASESHILKLDGEELEDTELMDLSTEEATLWAGCIAGTETVLQVTPSGMRLCREGSPTVEWKSPRGDIDKVAVNGHSGQVVVVSGNTLYYLICANMVFEEKSSKLLDFEVSCIDISSLDESKESKLVAVGLWSENSTALLCLPDLRQFVHERLPVEMLPRSVLLTKMERTVYLLIALGDGSLFYFTVDMEAGCLRTLKKASLGTHPPSLHSFESHGQTHVFACSDRPAVIFSSNNKLVFSNVNLKLLTQICSLNSATYRDCLVMSDGETLSIGTVDDIQKLHIRTVHLGESVKRVIHQKETSTLGILVHRSEMAERLSISRMALASSSSKPDPCGVRAQVSAENTTGEVHSFVVLDQNTYEPLHSHEFAPNEHAISIISGKLGEDPNTYYIVGTCLVYNDETEAKSGRLIIFEAGVGEERTRLRKVSEKEIKGAPYSMALLGTKLIVAVNSSVRLFEWPESEKPELRLECSHFNHIAALFVKVKGDQIVIGDLMRSMSVLSYKSMECTFEEVARDYRSMWMTAVEFVDAETVLGAESSFNLFTGEVDRETQEDKQRLKDSGQFYLGEMVNVFRRGSLVAGHVDSQLPIDKPILYGTSDGSIGLIVQLNEEYYKFLSEVEAAVAKETHNCMRVDHSVYRQFHSSRIVDKAEGFIDGDLIESVLEWPRDKNILAFKGICPPGGSAATATTEDIMKIIEDLSRTH